MEQEKLAERQESGVFRFLRDTLGIDGNTLRLLLLVIPAMFLDLLIPVCFTGVCGGRKPPYKGAPRSTRGMRGNVFNTMTIDMLDMLLELPDAQSIGAMVQRIAAYIKDNIMLEMETLTAIERVIFRAVNALDIGDHLNFGGDPKSMMEV